MILELNIHRKLARKHLHQIKDNEKLWSSRILQRAVSKFVHAEDIVVPYSATDLLTASRITHVVKMSKNDVLKMQLSGFYKETDLPSYGTGSTEYSDTDKKV